jgi:MinD-like ATPase involved in chromosome partitioning or flagellar assembly
VTGERYVVIGLAHVRSAWFTEVARWATVGSLPVEFVKCVSADELRARVAGGRRFSAALLDGRLAAVDRDLLATLRSAEIVTLVVEAGLDGPDWSELGATARLGPRVDRPTLLDALSAHATMIGLADDDRAGIAPVPAVSATWRGRMVAVTGRSGSGASTVAAALAQGLAGDPRYAGDVVLADLARHAHQALLHDARDVVPGIQEVVEAHRTGRPTAEQLRRLTFDVPGRGYRLVLGLRRPRDWVAIRPQAFAAALDGMRRTARIVVADTDADLEGEAETGSFDIEDRNLVARTTTAQADVVVVVATPSTSGIHGLVGQLEALRAHGVPGERTLAVVNRAPRSARARAELGRAIANLTGAADHADPHVGPVHVAERRHVDALHRDLARFPAALVQPATGAVRALLDRLPPRDLAERPAEPLAVVPGSLGRWADDEATS